MATWMTYSLLVGALLVAPALGLEALLRGIGFPGRSVWVAAMGAVLMLTTFPLSEQAPAAGSSGMTTLEGLTIANATVAEAVPIASGRATLSELGRLVEIPLAAVLRRTADLPGSHLAAAWIAMSISLLVLWGASVLRYRAARRRWPVARVAGQRVRIAPRAGPAVIGLVRPEIVVPAWLLERSEEEKHLVIAHEHEHVHARDPLLLAAGCLAVVVVPWNPVVWWMLHRLRVAVEVDCDARVLRRGVEKAEYGRLLIDLCGRSTGIPLGAAALTALPSTLERRLVAMTQRHTGRFTVRAATLTALGSAALVAACEARMPTSAEIEEMDVAAVESRTRLLIPAPAEGDVRYEIDGVAATAEQARALDAKKIASVQVVKGAAAARAGEEATAGGVIRIRTGGPEALTTLRGSRANPINPETGDPTGAGPSSDYVRFADFDGLLFIDGVRSDPGGLQGLRSGEIARVEILKGEAGVRLYGEEAAGGVIRITTRAASPEG